LPTQLAIAAQILLLKWHGKKRWLLSSTSGEQKTHVKSWELRLLLIKVKERSERYF
jgi:hypothetical protein